MNREEAAKRWEWVIENFNDFSVYLWPDQRQELLASIALLRGPVPDPETGLVPCGCGGALKFERFNDGFFDLERIACECGIEITSGPGFCKPAWNRAMGMKEADE